MNDCTCLKRVVCGYWFGRKAEMRAFLKPAALIALTNALAALPAHAEAGKIFDFNATLPIMVGQFLLLMVFLDKFWFGPVGKVLDERDALIRKSLGSVKVRHYRRLLGHFFRGRKKTLPVLAFSVSPALGQGLSMLDGLTPPNPPGMSYLLDSVPSCVIHGQTSFDLLSFARGFGIA
jgi:hypothetical protein